MATTCTALNLSDETKCTAEATSANGLFCRFHAKQCYGLYRGYKNRNARLDTLEASAPAYLANGKTPLRNESFEDVADEVTLVELHDYLFKRHALLDRVIRARKLHHSRFFSLSLDYGHKAYLDKLANDKFITLKALERLERRTAEVLYEQAKWFRWVRESQDVEEASRENESRQIKKETQLFKRHFGEIQVRMAKKRKQEDAKRQEAFLDKAYEERMQQMSEEEEIEWDPVEYELEQDRGKFIDMMKHLLWLESDGEVLEDASHKAVEADRASTDAVPDGGSGMTAGKENVDPATASSDTTQVLTKTMNRNQKKRAKKQAKEVAAPKEDVETSDSTARVEVNETKDQLCQRLLKGERFDRMAGLRGGLIGGTVSNPTETHGKILGLPENEVETLIGQIGEIKQLLMCRLLLSQAALLPAALRASSLEEFFMDPDVATPELRDLCLKLEQPSLQQIRDACADFARGDIEDDTPDEPSRGIDDDEQEVHDRAIDHAQRHGRLDRDGMPKAWKSKHEEKLDDKAEHRQKLREAEGKLHVDFGETVDEASLRSKKIKVRVCGRAVWNHPSEQAMARGGWLQFSIIARGVPLGEAIQLCRNWNEFWELNSLAVYQYFPSASWGMWSGTQERQQLLQMGFIPRFFFRDAEIATRRAQGGSRGMAPRSHSVSEYRNVICGHIKRNDPLHGDLFSSFKFGFNDHYDVIVWDNEAGLPSEAISNTVHYAMLKALRARNGLDLYRPMKATMETLHRERESMRARDARPGEKTIWDDINHSGSVFYNWQLDQHGVQREMTTEEVAETYYNDVDVAEDRVLFPEEDQGTMTKAVTGHSDRLTVELEEVGPRMDRFIHNLDTDEETPDPEENVNMQMKSRKKKRTKRNARSMSKKKNKVLATVESGKARNRSIKSGVAFAEQLKQASERAIPWSQGENDTCPNDWADGCECAACQGAGGSILSMVKQNVEEMQLGDADADWEDDEASDLDDDDLSDDDPDDVYAWDLALVEPDTRKLKKLKAFAFAEGPQREDVERSFAIHLDRERANVFKPQWHVADFEPGALDRYHDTLGFMALSKAINGISRLTHARAFKLLCWLDCHPCEHRLVRRDMQDTLAYVGMFFPDITGLPEKGEDRAIGVIREWRSENHTQSKLFDNEWKAAQPSYSRDWRSSALTSKEWYDQAFELTKTRKIWKQSDAIVRPQLAKLYKAGIIAPYHGRSPPGRAYAATDTLSNEKTMYLDYRETPNPITKQMLGSITDWRYVDLIQIARQYRTYKPDARFALLRVWSHSHFWPLMVGYDKRDLVSFEDPIGRVWRWKFYPKENGGGEWDMQAVLEQRFKRWRIQLGNNVTIRRDMVLVMGRDREELEEMMCGAVYFLITNPWSSEVDWWKSFVDVDVGFLEKLDKTWVE